MADIPRLKSMIEKQGLSIRSAAEQSGISVNILYNRLKGRGEFRASEVAALTKTLRLTRQERDEIFLL